SSVGSASKAPSAAADATAPSPHEEKPAGTCEHSCRALSSMKRAVEALCRMAGDADDRCLAARRTLTSSTTRVLPCRCDD
ncbi:MAG TPA: hypothetical protein VM580_15250, partial [Labilithrix sp.]|nr:hypothetical protein [Labilithrix sp.]